MRRTAWIPLLFMMFAPINSALAEGETVSAGFLGKYICGFEIMLPKGDDMFIGIGLGPMVDEGYLIMCASLWLYRRLDNGNMAGLGVATVLTENLEPGPDQGTLSGFGISLRHAPDRGKKWNLGFEMDVYFGLHHSIQGDFNNLMPIPGIFIYRKV